jgi:alpha-tubulin suppressor-like RCC1 family protein
MLIRRRLDSRKCCTLLILAVLAVGCHEEKLTEPAPSFDAASGNNPAVKVEIDRDTLNALGQTAQLTSNIPVQWISLSLEIADVDGEGRLVSKAVGTALIQGYAGRKADTVSVTVRQIPAEVRVTPPTVSLLTGDTTTLSATVVDSMAHLIPGAAVTWTSSTAAVASVSAGGLVTGLTAGSSTITAASTPAKVGTAIVSIQQRGPWRSVTAGLNHTCGLTKEGAAYCWGEGGVGQLGADPSAPRSRPQPVVGGLRFTSLSAGDSHTCGITPDWNAYCWGYNYIGQLGNGSVDNSFVPIKVAGGLALQTISAGNVHTCALTLSGNAYCWGADFGGVLGTGQPGPDGCQFSPCALTPQPVAGGLTFTVISAGDTETCGVTSTGQAYCWGQNTYGQLGDGTRQTRAVPTPVYGGLVFASTTAGRSHVCGLTQSGGTFCWGRSDFGQVAAPDGSAEQLTPAPVMHLTGRPANLSAGFLHTCRTSDDGTAECWGNNSFGQLGDGTTRHAFSRVLVTGNLKFQQIESGGNHTCGLSRADYLYCWGYNVAGQLGTGTQSGSPQLLPVQVLSVTP